MAGLVRNKDGTAPRGCMGSPGFMAPEICHGAEHAPSIDIYALGVLLFVMLTG